MQYKNSITMILYLTVFNSYAMQEFQGDYHNPFGIYDLKNKTLPGSTEQPCEEFISEEYLPAIITLLDRIKNHEMVQLSQEAGQDNTSDKKFLNDEVKIKGYGKYKRPLESVNDVKGKKCDTPSSSYDQMPKKQKKYIERVLQADEEALRCCMCFRENKKILCKTKKEMQQHLFQKHGIGREPLVCEYPNVLDPKQVCGRNFPALSGLIRHWYQRHNSCFHCGKLIALRNKLIVPQGATREFFKKQRYEQHYNTECQKVRK